MTPTQNSPDTILLVRGHDGKKKKAPHPPRMWTMYGIVPKQHNFQKSHLEKDDSHPKKTTAIMVFDILCGEAPLSLSSPDPALRNPAQGHRYVFWGHESGCFQFLSSNTACWLSPSGRLHRKNVKDRWQKTAIHLCTSNKTSSFVSRFCSFVEFFAPQSLLTHLQWTQSVYHSA